MYLVASFPESIITAICSLARTETSNKNKFTDLITLTEANISKPRYIINLYKPNKGDYSDWKKNLLITTLSKILFRERISPFRIYCRPIFQINYSFHIFDYLSQSYFSIIQCPNLRSEMQFSLITSKPTRMISALVLI